MQGAGETWRESWGLPFGFFTGFSAGEGALEEQPPCQADQGLLKELRGAAPHHPLRRCWKEKTEREAPEAGPRHSCLALNWEVEIQAFLPWAIGASSCPLSVPLPYVPV